MHDDQPTLIMVKRAIAGPSIITPGMGFMKARKAMLHADGLDAGAPRPLPDDESKSGMSRPSDDHIDQMKEIAKQLYKASDMHKGQADKLMALCDEKPLDRPSTDDDSYGEKKEL